MKPSTRIPILTCLLVYATSAHGIMVKFNTNEGPIVPPTPEPSVPPPKPYRAPAPVWEETANDAPDPNAQWRPRPFIPQPMYTRVTYERPSPPAQNNAQRFVNSYLPNKPHQPIPAQPITSYFTPTQIVSQLSSQSLPGFGLRYFVPNYVDNFRQGEKRQEDAKYNDIQRNDVGTHDDAHEQKWKYDKEAGKRTARNSQKSTVVRPVQYVYQWPAYVHRQQ